MKYAEPPPVPSIPADESTLAYIRVGKKLTRSSWKPYTMYISLQRGAKEALERSAFARYLGDPSVALP